MKASNGMSRCRFLAVTFPEAQVFLGFLPRVWPESRGFLGFPDQKSGEKINSNSMEL